MKTRSFVISYIICSIIYLPIIIGIGYSINNENIIYGILALYSFLIPFSVLIALFTGKYREPNWFPITRFFWFFLPTELAKTIERNWLNKGGTAHEFFENCAASKKAHQMERDELSNREFDVNWNNVLFQTGKIDIYLQERHSYIDYPCASHSIYEAYKKMFTSQFGDIKIRIKNGAYYVTDESVLLIIRLLELMEEERIKYIEKASGSNPEILNALYNQQTIIITIKATKSDYLNHLLKFQANEINIIKTSECCSYATSSNCYYERAFVFAIMNNSGKYCVIYENENEDKASIVATVSGEEQCYACANAMIKYMKSHNVNKRETLRSTHRIEEFMVKSINHDDIATWKNHVTGDYYKRLTYKYHYKRRWRKW